MDIINETSSTASTRNEPSKPQERPEAKPMLSGKKVRKPFSQLVSETFIKGDIEDVKETILKSIVDQVKWTCLDTLSLIFFETTCSDRRRHGERTNYRRISESGSNITTSDNRNVVRAGSSRGRDRRRPIYIETDKDLADIEDVLEYLEVTYLTKYQDIRVYDVYSTFNVPTEKSDKDWGWTSLDKVQRYSNNGGRTYIVEFPAPEYLE